MSFQSTNIWARGWSYTWEALFIITSFCGIMVILSCFNWIIKIAKKDIEIKEFKTNNVSVSFFIISPIIIITMLLSELIWRIDAFYGISTFYVSYWWHYFIFTFFTYLVILGIWIVKGLYLKVFPKYKKELMSFKQSSLKIGNTISIIAKNPKFLISKKVRASCKETNNTLDKVFSPAKGTIVPLSQVKDEAFATGVLGKGFGIKTIGTKVQFTAPLDGEIATIFPTGHAYGITSKNGTSILVHIGIDTVKLKGENFTIISKQGDKVTTGQTIIEANITAIKKLGYDITTMVVSTPETKGNIELIEIKSKQTISKEDIIITVKE